MSEISEYQVVDNYFELDLVQYKDDPKKISKSLTKIFANHGLEIIQFDSRAYNTIKSRYDRILKRIIDNNRHGKSKYNSFQSPEKLFFSTEDFPELCATQTTTTTTTR